MGNSFRLAWHQTGIPLHYFFLGFQFEHVEQIVGLYGRTLRYEAAFGPPGRFPRPVAQRMPVSMRRLRTKSESIGGLVPRIPRRAGLGEQCSADRIGGH